MELDDADWEKLRAQPPPEDDLILRSDVKSELLNSTTHHRASSSRLPPVWTSTSKFTPALRTSVRDMAQHLSHPSQSNTVLGKRKASTFSSTRYPTPKTKFMGSESPVSSEVDSSEDSDFSPSEDEIDDQQDGEASAQSGEGRTSRVGHINSRLGSLMLVNGKLVPSTKKKYYCTWDGCEKSYSKPSRLEEHERSHTAEVGLHCDSDAVVALFD